MTVGNEEKKQFLVKNFDIPNNRIFSSKNTDFQYEVMKQTDYNGVDIVVNSLTDDLLDASIDCLATSGRFLELGKYEAQRHKKLNSKVFLKDISYNPVSFDDVTTKVLQNLYEWLHNNCENGMIRPLPRKIFNIDNANEALRYMISGQHIGKIIIKVRDEEIDYKKSIESSDTTDTVKPLMVNTKTYFDPNKVYIITGGLGGMGLELIHWMLYFGARKFVLTSRQGLKNNYQKFIIKRIECFGKQYQWFENKICISTQNTETIEGTKTLISEAQNLGPIGGVFHLAVDINDNLLIDQTLESFELTVKSKTNFCLNMDRLSRDMSLDLDYFCVFSSVSCGFGRATQTNYGLGNSLCERICEQRRAHGLHGLAIQFGVIGDVGIMTQDKYQSQANKVYGVIQAQRILSCFEVLDKLLQNGKPVVTSWVSVDMTFVLNDPKTILKHSHQSYRIIVL